MGASIVYWRKGPNCCRLFLLYPLNATCPALCLMFCLIVNALLRLVSYALASIILPSAASISILSPIALSYIVKALAFKALRY